MNQTIDHQPYCPLGGAPWFSIALPTCQCRANHLELPNKKPYKCPVCEGEGRNKLDTPLTTKLENGGSMTCFSISCVPCEGKGIVWG